MADPSPAAVFAEHCRRGVLAYQWDPVAERPVWYPRVVAPGTGATPEWRESRGLGTVYATTTVRRRGEPPANVALIDLDEGFRMMSRVDAEDVRIGMRVQVAFDGETPIFVAA